MAPISNPTNRAVAIAVVGAAILPLLLSGCNRSAPTPGSQNTAPSKSSPLPRIAIEQQQRRERQLRLAGLRAGHQATINCLRSERAQTDANELRCEDWSYVRSNYGQP